MPSAFSLIEEVTFHDLLQSSQAAQHFINLELQIELASFLRKMLLSEDDDIIRKNHAPARNEKISMLYQKRNAFTSKALTNRSTAPKAQL